MADLLAANGHGKVCKPGFGKLEPKPYILDLVLRSHLVQSMTDLMAASGHVNAWKPGIGKLEPCKLVAT